MPEQSNQVVVLFADISESSRLYQALGNADAQSVVSRCLNVLSTVADGFRGRVVKTIGDEVLCVFPSAAAAAQAAGEMQVGMTRAYDGQDLPFGRIRIRIGMHLGKVLEEAGDVFGETVHVAARMVRSAKPDQILTTAPTIDMLPEELRGAVRFVDEQTLRGKRHKLKLYEIIWEVSELTDAHDQTIAEELRTRHKRLTLHYQGQRLKLDQENPLLTIGRSRRNTIVIENALTSRKHARIELRRSRFMLTDQSVNGTFVVRSDGREILLRRDSHALEGQGAIGIGEQPHGESELSIEYACRK